MQWRHLPRAIACLPLASLIWAPTVFSQAQTKTIIWPKVSVYNSNTKTEPDTHATDRLEEIEIEAIVVEGRTITISEPFSATDDWLKNIGFRIKNVSGKPLAKIQISLVLPDMGVSSPQIPFGAVIDEKGLQADEEIELTMPAGGLYSWVKDRVAEKGSISRINTAQILVVYVGLMDGTVRSSECTKTADPKNACPGRPPKTKPINLEDARSLPANQLRLLSHPPGHR